MLNDVFVSGLPGLVDLSVHPQWSHSLQYARISVFLYITVIPLMVTAIVIKNKCYFT